MANRGNENWSSDAPMPWPDEYFGIRPLGRRSSLADPVNESSRRGLVKRTVEPAG